MKTILIVDDEPQVLRVTGAILEKAGYRVLVADTAERALKILSKQRLDMAIVDHWLGETTSVELRGRLLLAQPGIRILHITGDLPELGFEAHLLVKPFSGEQLRAKVAEMLES